MSNRFRAASAFLTFVFVLAGADARSANDVDALARDVDRLESVRQVKDLQRSHAHYAQFGLWDEMASLFVRDASLIMGSQNVRGRAAIAGSLTRRGGGRRGLAPGALHAELIDEPLVNLSVDGRSAKGRWMSISMLGDGKGSARLEGGGYLMPPTGPDRLLDHLPLARTIARGSWPVSGPRQLPPE